jgi:thiamine monophosphate synthase
LFGLFVDDLWLALGIAGWLAIGGLLLADIPWTVTACAMFTAGLSAVLALSAVRRAAAAERR